MSHKVSLLAHVCFFCFVYCVFWGILSLLVFLRTPLYSFLSLSPSPCVCVCLFVCLHTCVCVWRVKVDEKPRVWQGSHCGHCCIYTSSWHGLCVKYTVLLWLYKKGANTHTHTRSSVAFIFTSFTTVRICFKPELKASRIRMKELELINLVKPLMLHTAAGLSQRMSQSVVCLIPHRLY